jgi:hypothetical protein
MKTTPLSREEGEKVAERVKWENTNHEWTRRDTNFEQQETEGKKREKRPLTLALSQRERESLTFEIWETRSREAP